jgi:hypothetical protein
VAHLLKTGVAPRRIGYAAVDHPLLHELSLERIVEFLFPDRESDETHERFVLLDEIQYLKDWEIHLKSLVDNRPNLRLLVSGSAAAALQRKSVESGAGRFTDFMLPPLTFAEYLDLRSEPRGIDRVTEHHFVVKDIALLNRQFVEYVNFGGFPELALQEALRADPARFIKSDIVEKVLLKDLPSLYGISDIQELNALFALLAYNTGEEVSLQALAQRRGITKPTIETYIKYLEAAFLVRRIYRVDQDGNRYTRERGFKIYLNNPAMRCGLFGPMQADDEGFGHLVETAVYAQRLQGTVRLNYARWKTGEVDMVELDPRLRPAHVCEVKWSDAAISDDRVIRSVLKFAKDHGLSNSFVTTRSKFAEVVSNGFVVNCVPTAAIAYAFGIASLQSKLDSYRAAFSSAEDEGYSPQRSRGL